MRFQKILLIDDDEEDHEIFLTALSHVSNEFQCTSFYDASEALVKLQGKEMGADLIFLDLNMLIMSARNFYRI